VFNQHVSRLQIAGKPPLQVFSLLLPAQRTGKGVSRRNAQHEQKAVHQKHQSAFQQDHHLCSSYCGTECPYSQEWGRCVTFILQRPHSIINIDTITPAIKYPHAIGLFSRSNIIKICHFSRPCRGNRKIWQLLIRQFFTFLQEICGY
jgi:hypothetical protein